MDDPDNYTIIPKSRDELIASESSKEVDNVIYLYSYPQ